MSPLVFAMVSLVLLIPVMSYEQTDWLLKKEKDGIKIFSRLSDQSKFNELKVEFTTKGSLSQLSSIILDVEKNTDWVYNTKSAMLIKKLNADEVIFYSEVALPWPMSNRDFYSHLKVHRDSINKTLTVDSRSMPDYLPRKNSIVRIPISQAHWLVTTANSELNITYILRVNPGGAVPAWVSNMFSTKGPYESFKKLKEKMESGISE
ncbi:MAG: lipid-binding domain protein [Chitinophagaceae bacterium]|nr:lipid-binding domain protein [Chitinophagaceae bacterium]